MNHERYSDPTADIAVHRMWVDEKKDDLMKPKEKQKWMEEWNKTIALFQKSKDSQKGKGKT